MTSPAANKQRPRRHRLPDPPPAPGLRRPICSVFAGLPRPSSPAAAQALRRPHQLPADIAPYPRPIEVFTYAATISADLAARVEAEMTDQELTAVATATPTPYVHDV